MGEYPGGGPLSASDRTPAPPGAAEARPSDIEFRFPPEPPRLTPDAARALLKVLVKARSAQEGRTPATESRT